LNHPETELEYNEVSLNKADDEKVAAALAFQPLEMQGMQGMSSLRQKS